MHIEARAYQSLVLVLHPLPQEHLLLDLPLQRVLPVSHQLDAVRQGRQNSGRRRLEGDRLALEVEEADGG